ncbi:uncharacterized protein LOC111064501 isoform X3 [Nilaparvata lugens]|uniref:uncharacterized protein LOC111064501 isoform X3 n=2 Tax=Nilaparvata lugens TaxID=108931 RepID=UPI00193D7638|nr:uncharacterized protein LOC111064501 isoform X3 [Nilaparvata lugens]
MEFSGRQPEVPYFIEDYRKRKEENRARIARLAKNVNRVIEGASTSANPYFSTESSEDTINADPPRDLCVTLDIEKFFSGEEWASKTYLERKQLRYQLETYRYSLKHTSGRQLKVPYFIKDYKKRKEENRARIARLAKNVNRVIEGASTSANPSFPTESSEDTINADPPRDLCVTLDIEKFSSGEEWASKTYLERKELRYQLETYRYSLKHTSGRQPEVPYFIEDYKKRKEENRARIARLAKNVNRVIEGASTSANPSFPTESSEDTINADPPRDLCVTLDIEKFFSGEEWASKTYLERKELRSQLETYRYSLKHTSGRQPEVPYFIKDYKKRKEENRARIARLAKNVNRVIEGASTSANPYFSTESSEDTINADPPRDLCVTLDIEKFFSGEEWASKTHLERKQLRFQLETYRYSLKHTSGRQPEVPYFIEDYKKRKEENRARIARLAKNVNRVIEGASTSANPYFSTESSEDTINADPPRDLCVTLDIEKFFSGEEWASKTHLERKELRFQLETYRYSLKHTSEATGSDTSNRAVSGSNHESVGKKHRRSKRSVTDGFVFCDLYGRVVQAM